MSTPYNKVSKDIRNQILERVKTSGKSIAEISQEHGIGKTTIYEWLRESTGEAPARDLIKLTKENKELKQIIGELTVQMGRQQKRGGSMRVMKKFGLKPYRRHRKPFKRSNTSIYNKYSNLLKTTLLTKINQIWVTDGIQISMSEKGSPWQNGYQESFYDKFKIDLGDPNRFETLGELVYEIYHTIYIYNTTRIHTSLKMSPREFVLKNQLS